MNSRAIKRTFKKLAKKKLTDFEFLDVNTGKEVTIIVMNPIVDNVFKASASVDVFTKGLAAIMLDDILKQLRDYTEEQANE